MKYEEALKYIHGLLRFGIKPGLERIARLLEWMGNPQKQLKFIHVAGTNGKGSTCAMLSTILRKAGYKTGLYISPFVVDFRERMQIDGQMIPKESLAEIVEQLVPLVTRMREEGEDITEFELVTAAAFAWYAKEKCEIVVLEVGLGGRFDATNVIDCPLVSVICAIDLDHTAILGDSLEKIAFEKCGILKENGAIACYPRQHPEADETIRRIASERNNRWFQINPDAIEIEGESLDGTEILWDNHRFHIPLLGRHQVFNAATVLAAIQALRDFHGYSISWEQAAEGISSTVFPARLEILSREPLVLLDGGHNPAGATALAAALCKYCNNKKIIAIMGMMKDKDYDQAISQLAPLFAQMFTITVDNPRTLQAEELAETARNYCSQVQPCTSDKEAVMQAFAALHKGEVLVVCGSFYLSAELRPLLIEQIRQGKQ